MAKKKSPPIDNSREGIIKTLSNWSDKKLYELLSQKKSEDTERIIYDCAKILIEREAKPLLGDFLYRYNLKVGASRKVLIEGEIKGLEINKTFRLRIAFKRDWELLMFNDGYVAAITSKPLEELLKKSLQRINEQPETIYPECVGFAYGTVERYYRELLRDAKSPYPIKPIINNIQISSQQVDVISSGISDAQKTTFAAFIYIMGNLSEIQSLVGYNLKKLNDEDVSPYLKRMCTLFGYNKTSDVEINSLRVQYQKVLSLKGSLSSYHEKIREAIYPYLDAVVAHALIEYLEPHKVRN